MAAARNFPVNGQWSIDTTAKSVITLSAGLLAATLSDDVQPLAVIACERYGATLAMCSETCAKVERLAKRKRTSHVFASIGVKIGFAPNDVSDQLASNEAGVRFLSLLAALLSVGSAFRAAQYLHNLLDWSSPEKQRLPTVAQLKELILVLERKVSTAGFTENLEVWDVILRSNEVGFQDRFPHIRDDGFYIDEANSRRTKVSNTTNRSRVDQSISRDNSTISNENTTTCSSVSDSTGINTPLSMDNDASSAAEHRSRDGDGGVKVLEDKFKNIQHDLPHEDVTNVVSSKALLRSLSVDKIGLSELFTGLWSTQDAEKEPKSVKVLAGSSENLENPRSGCPSPMEVSKLIRAMSEMERIGQASFTVVRTPPLAAVWTITFIRWCLGIEPYIRRMPDEQLVLKQVKSNVLVEIGHYETTTFSIKTFKTSQGILELLWASQSTLTRPVAWGGMMRIKTYFNTRLQKIQSSYRILRLASTLLFLASETDNCFNPIKSSTFMLAGLTSSNLISLVAMYFDIKDPANQIGLQKPTELREIWNRYPRIAAEAASELFGEIVVSAYLENVHDQVDPEIYVECGHSPIYQVVPSELVLLICDFLLIGPGPETERNRLLDGAFDGSLEGGLDNLLGARFTNAASGSTVASSNKGQVTYLRLLETLEFHPRYMHRKIALPGWLQFEEQRYPFMTGVEDRGNEFDLRFDEVQTNDYSDQPFESKILEDNPRWMLSADDEHLQIYLAPYRDRNVSLEVRPSMLGASGITMFIEECSSTCATLTTYLPDLRYCRTVAAALSESHAYSIRVLYSSQTQIDFSYALAAVGRWTERTRYSDTAAFFSFVCEGACLACMCYKATNFVQGNMWSQSARAVIVIIL